jgi:DNA ligase 1
MFKDVVNIFNQIKETPSRNDKELILGRHKDNEEFKRILQFLYNPYVLTGIKFKKLVKFANFTSDKVKQFSTVFEAIDYIAANNTGRDEDVQIIANFINTYDTDIKSPVHDFLQEMFTKDYKCGITSSTINKIFGKNWIPTFDVMLAKKFEDEEHKIKGEFGITLKLDGIRAVAIKENGNVKFFTRQGQIIEDLVELEQDYKTLPDNTVYDGELLLDDHSGMPSDDLFRATQKVVRKDGKKFNINHILFDIIPLAEFKLGKSKKDYADRMLDLHEGLDIPNGSFIKKTPILYWGNDKSKVFEILDKVVSEGKEGLIVNNGSGFYVTKRSDNLLKVKKMQTVDLRVLDIQEGTGKNVGKLGALIVDYKGYQVGVGSGFTDNDRELYWNNPELVLNNIVEIQYFEESKNQDGGISLRFPVFKRIRDDKTDPSLY